MQCVHFYDCFDHFRHYTYVKTYQIVKFKYVQFIMSNLFKNKEREKTFPVCSFWFHCGQCTEKEKSIRGEASQLLNFSRDCGRGY